MTPLSLSPLFSDHAVLHRAGAVPVWGEAAPGTAIGVTFDGWHGETVTSAEGRWEVVLNTTACGEGPFELLVEGGGERVRSVDILVGEVWLCGGQSNMEFRLIKEAGAATEIPAAAYPRLRQFRVANTMSQTPTRALEGTWTLATPECVGNFTSVGFYFGRRLTSVLGCPVGLISNSWGNTPSESWTSAEALDRIPALKAARRRDAAWPVRPGDEQIEGLGSFPGDTRLPKQRACVLFNAMVAPLIPCAIRGILWYQGESNAPRAVQYREAFPLLINDWRSRWGRGDLPFYFCQVAGYTTPTTEPGESTWAELREAQTRALALPATAMAVLVDVGEAEDIHPRNKRDAGERLARIALARDYEHNLRDSGPLFRSHTVEGDCMRLFFDHAEGLMAAPLPARYDVRTLDGTTAPLPIPLPESPLQGFALCGEDRRWHWAHAVVEGETVRLHSPRVPAPVAVRYGWAQFPICNLTNASGLPASPFRTDDFPELTRDAQY